MIFEFLPSGNKFDFLLWSLLEAYRLNFPRWPTWEADQDERLNINLSKNDTMYREKTNETKYVLK